LAPRPITSALIADLFIGFQTSFQNGFAGVSPQWGKIATEVTSNTSEENYGWLGSWPAIREWLGDRVVEELAGYDYQLKNRSFETTVKVKKDDIADDRFGIYSPMFVELGRQVSAFPDVLSFGALAAGRTSKCYDGQNFFDTDHPVQGGVAANVDSGGAGAWWYLLSTQRALKPLIYQNRQPFAFTALDQERDEPVFRRKEFEYGSDGRCNVGYGFWQMAYASNQALDADHYEAARAAMGALTDDSGQPLGIVPDLLVVGTSLEGAGRRLLKRSVQAAGATNEWEGSADLLVSPYLP
jgi:phage major head subunit gpT-like protein